MQTARGEISILLGYHQLKRVSVLDANYLAALVHQRIDAAVSSGQLLNGSYLPSTTCLDLIEDLQHLSGEQWMHLARSLPKPDGITALDADALMPGRAMNEETTARRLLSIGVLPINDLALLAAHVHLRLTQAQSFKTTDVTTILNQHNCDPANISSALNSMTQATRKVDARLSKVGGDYEMTTAGAGHVKRLLSMSYQSAEPAPQPPPPDAPSP